MHTLLEAARYHTIAGIDRFYAERTTVIKETRRHCNFSQREEFPKDATYNRLEANLRQF